MLIDTHAHLELRDFEKDLAEVLKRAKNAGVGRIVNIGSSLKGSKGSVELADKYDEIYATLGLHPFETKEFGPEVLERFAELSKNKKVVAIGEIGLDFYNMPNSEEEQKDMFVAQLKLAKDLDLPVVIHIRDAFSEAYEILKNEKLRAVIHCFTAGRKHARKFLDLGFYISFTSNVTYPNFDFLQKVIRGCPMDRMMIETDAPFLPPFGKKGERNEPAYVTAVAEKIAEVTGKSFDEMAKQTTENAIEFFKL